MIPARVKADIKPPVQPNAFDIAESHPLAEYNCPACDDPLTARLVVLVIVGFHPEDRRPSGWATGASVAVHMDCAGYTEEELAVLADRKDSTDA